MEIGHDLEVRDHRRSGLLGQRDDVRKVVEVTVGNEYGVYVPDLLVLLWRRGVVGQEGIYDDLFGPGGCYPEGRVPEVGYPGPTKHLVHFLPPFIGLLLRNNSFRACVHRLVTFRVAALRVTNRSLSQSYACSPHAVSAAS